MYRKLFFITVFMVLLGGCGVNNSVDDVMRPPKLSITEEKVKNEIDNILEGGGELVTPLKGDNMSSVNFKDLDKDGKEEIFILYKTNKDYPLRILILSRRNNGWYKDNTIKGIGHNFDMIDFKDITGNGNSEILVTYNGGEYNNKVINIYSYGKENINNIFNNTYEKIACQNLDHDGAIELVLIKLDKLKGPRAQLYRGDGNKINLINEVKLDKRVIGYYNILIGNPKSNTKGLFIDGSILEYASITELLVVDKGKLKNVFYDKNTGIVDKTYREYYCLSEDIDDDGFIEIPKLRRPRGYEGKDFNLVPWIYSWYSWDGSEGLDIESEGYHNLNQGYYFEFPQKWDYNITLNHIYKNLEKDMLIFSYLYNNKAHHIFTITTFKVETWNSLNKEKKEGYMELARSKDKIYLVSFSNKKYKNKEIRNKVIGIDEIKNNLKILY
ncbi:hypothetical protein [Dethiothermospora halolimnae]|uniref:hypothetical protein n=1 Tax=Dethiothermospora halolimnae TaxID=3114390 RepID=UPI003CCBF2EE